MRVTLTTIALVIAAVALAAPARAASTAALTAATPSFSGACPTTTAFTGSISGPPGTALQYSFNRFINGAQQVQNVGAVTLPASGTIAVSDAFSTGITSTGINFDQIWVHNIAGGQPDVYSNRAGFSVACGSAGTTGGVQPVNPGKGRTGIYAQQLRLPAPTNVHATTDPRECAAHLPPGAFLLTPVCAEILTQGGAEIVFAWQGTPSLPDADGFHVYNVAGHVSNPGMSSSAGGSNTVVLEKGPVSPACYVIRAYLGAKESNDSAQVCLAGGSSSRTVSLNTTDVRSATGSSLDGKVNTRSSGVVYVGHSYWYDKEFAGDQVFNFYSRAGVLFDVQSLHANFIFKAVLRLHMTGGNGDPNIEHPSSFPTHSCMSEVGLGTNLWWQGVDMMSGDFSSSESPTGYTDVRVDVTREVRDWVKGKPNLGFVLRGDDENLSAFTRSACDSEYAVPAQLDVTYN